MGKVLLLFFLSSFASNFFSLVVVVVAGYNISSDTRMESAIKVNFYKICIVIF